MVHEDAGHQWYIRPASPRQTGNIAPMDYPRSFPRNNSRPVPDTGRKSGRPPLVKTVAILIMRLPCSYVLPT
jgi:hypothetical protein